MIRAIALGVVTWIVLIGELRAAPPTINTIFPTAARRGVDNSIQVVGKSLDKQPELIVPFQADVRLQSKSTEAPTFSIKPAPDTPPGFYPLRVRTAEGISNLRLFAVTDVPVIRTKRSTSEYKNGRIQPDQAQPIEWPAIVAGERLSQDVDLFRFSAKAGQRLLLITETRRLGMTPDPVIRLRDANGRTMALEHDTPGLRADERMDFTFQRDGDYLVELQSFGVAGWNNHYLFKIGAFNYARTVFPLGGRRGETVRLTVVDQDGKNSTIETKVPDDPWLDRWQLHLPAFPGSLPWTMASGDLPELMEAEIDVRDDDARRGSPDPAETRDRRSPTAGDLRSVGVARSGDRPQRTGDRPQREIQPPLVNWPVTINGRIDEPGEEDLFRIAVKEGQHIRVRVEAFYLGSALDGFLAVYDPIGKKLLAKNDDQRYRGNPDPALTFEVSAGINEVFISLRDTMARGGVEFPYRLTIERGGPDFYLWLGKPQTPYTAEGGGWYKMDASDTLNLAVGKEVKFTVSVRRTGKDDPNYGGPIQGYEGPICLKVVDLPKGVTVKPTVIAAGKKEGELSFTAATDAPREPFEVVIVGEATRDDGSIIRRVAERKIFISDAQMTHLPWNLRVRKLVCVVNDL